MRWSAARSARAAGDIRLLQLVAVERADLSRMAQVPPPERLQRMPLELCFIARGEKREEPIVRRLRQGGCGGEEEERASRGVRRKRSYSGRRDCGNATGEEWRLSRVGAGVNRWRQVVSLGPLSGTAIMKPTLRNGLLHQLSR